MTNIHILKKHLKNLGKAIRLKKKGRRSRSDDNMGRMDWDRHLIQEKINGLRAKVKPKR